MYIAYQYKSFLRNKFMRLFIAIGIDDSVREGCVKIMGSLKDSGADIRTVRPENLHVTLKFLGEVREDDVKLITNEMDDFSGSFGPFTLGFSTLGFFGNPRFPRVVWIGISEGRENVRRMCEDLGKRLFHIRNEDKKPRPHLTLGRVRSPVNSENLLETIRSMRDVKLGELRVKEIKLMSSILGPGGPAYTDIKAFTLRGEPA